MDSSGCPQGADESGLRAVKQTAVKRGGIRVRGNGRTQWQAALQKKKRQSDIERLGKCQRQGVEEPHGRQSNTKGELRGEGGWRNRVGSNQ